jgi:hypothetical protein
VLYCFATDSSFWRQALEAEDHRCSFFFFFQLNPYGHSPYVTTSLTRGWVCLLWICLAFRQVYVSHIQRVTENVCFCTVCKSPLNRGFAKQIMPILRILCYNGSLVTWMDIRLTTTKFKPLIFPMSGFALSYEHVQSHDFVWLLPVACTILLYNNTHMESWKPCANRRAACTLQNFQWCGNLVLQALQF